MRANARAASLALELEEYEDPDAEVVVRSAGRRSTLVLTRVPGCPRTTRVAVSTRDA